MMFLLPLGILCGVSFGSSSRLVDRPWFQQNSKLDADVEHSHAPVTREAFTKEIVYEYLRKDVGVDPSV
jgi:hypothetical protein